MARRIGLLAALLVLIGAGAWLLFGRGGDPAPVVTEVTAVPVHGLPDTLLISLKIDNRGGPDRLTGAMSPESADVVIAGAVGTDGLAIPAGSAPALASDGAHLELHGLSGDLADGRLIPLTLNFEKAGDITTRARVNMTKPDGSPAHAMHNMEALHEVPEGEPAPTLAMRLTPDGEGWLVHLDLANVELSSDLADKPHKPGTGHAHLYLNGLKLQRMYSTEARIGALPPGQYMVRVVLNTNDHQAYAVGGEPVEAMALIDVR